MWTTAGLVDVFVLFFLQAGSRHVHVAGMTAQPDRPWMVQQARNVAMHFAEQPEKPTILLRDHDTKFVPEFDAILAGEGVEVKKVGPRAPNMNALAERWVQSIRQECLDHFIILGEAHLRHLISEYLAHYLEERPHQSKDNLPLVGSASPVASVEPASVGCRERLGGLLRHYYWQAN